MDNITCKSSLNETLEVLRNVGLEELVSIFRGNFFFNLKLEKNKNEICDAANVSRLYLFRFIKSHVNRFLSFSQELVLLQ